MNSSNGAKIYTCPMHPEVVSDQPGNCPKCGMNLIPKEQKAHDQGQQGLGSIWQKPWMIAIVIVVFALGALIFGRGNFGGFFPIIILLLLCPVAMMFMMRGKGH